jgi:hypothetical protein
MFTVICRGVTYKTHDYMSKFKVTFRGQRSKLCNLYLVRPTTSRVIVVSLWYLVEMFTLICRRVTYKTYDSMSKVTLKGQRYKFCSINFVQDITSQIIVVSSWYLLDMFTLICWCVKYRTHDSMSKVKVKFRGQWS